jgi:hypothetical protein
MIPRNEPLLVTVRLVARVMSLHSSARLQKHVAILSSLRGIYLTSYSHAVLSQSCGISLRNKANALLPQFCSLVVVAGCQDLLPRMKRDRPNHVAVPRQSRNTSRFSAVG